MFLYKVTMTVSMLKFLFKSQVIIVHNWNYCIRNYE